jgi:hypothetical protein
MCTNCNDNNAPYFSLQSFINSSCTDCDNSCWPSNKVCYTGGDLPCSGILKNDTIEDALVKIDAQICSALGDYSAYQKNCLPAWFEAPINDEATFVDAITAYACTIASNLGTFTGTTFPQYQSSVAAQISNITGPSISCTSAGVITSDNLTTILTKYCAKFSNLDDAIDLTDVDFGDCFTVTSQPQNIHQGFAEVLQQICQVKALAEANSGTLPTFDNIGSCLAAPLTSSDTLVSTVNKIKTKLCSIDSSFVGSDINWGCEAPDGDSLQEAVQALADTTDALVLNELNEFSADFVVELIDSDVPCAGKKISLATPLTQDRFVAASPSDTSPATLIDKLNGVDISVDDTTLDGKVTLIPAYKLKAASGDDAPSFLINKLNGSTASGITITPTYNPTTKVVDLILSVDNTTLCALFSNCGNTCTTYTVTPSGSSSLSYVDCDGNSVEFSSITGATTFCAQLNSVYAPNATIVNVGPCIPDPLINGFLLLNNSTTVSISDVNTAGDPFFTISTGVFPVVPTETLTAIGTTSAAVTVVTTIGNGSAKLYKNNVLQETISMVGGGSWDFAAVTFATGDDMKIIVEDLPLTTTTTAL